MASQVITQARKTVSFKSPYIGSTFQQLAQDLLGRDGYLSGGATTDNGVTITVTPFKLVSRGIVGETLANSLLDVPSGSAPWFIIASVPDDDPASGVAVQVTRSLELASSGVVIASKSGDIWRNTHPVDVAGALRKAADVGAEDGFSGSYDNTAGAYTGTDGTTVVDKVFSNKGRAVTPEGVRLLTDSLAGESAKQFSSTPNPASSLGRRTDKIVLRQREPFSTEIAYLLGGTQDGGTSAVIGTGTSGVAPHYYAKRGGSDGDQWWVWVGGAGDNELHIYGGIGGSAFGDTLLLTGGGLLTSPWFAGQRSSDDALVVLYLDGGDLQMVAFHPTTGAKIGTETNLDGLPNTINRVTGVLDPNDLVHAVFEYDDLTVPSQQIYYGRFSAVIATFGAVATAPKYAAGAVNSTFNDTKPQIGICRNGVTHIVFIRGTGSNQYGDLVYTKLDSSDALIDSTTYLPATDVAQPDAQFKEFIDGVASVSFHSFTDISLTVTVHDEVYVSLGAGETTQPVNSILIFSPSFVERLGFPIIRVDETVPLFASASLSITSGDSGEIMVSISFFAVTTTLLVAYHLGPQPGVNGLADMLLGGASGAISGGSATSATNYLAVSPTGELVLTQIGGTGVEYIRLPGGLASTTPLTHPSDTLLEMINVDLHASNTVEEQGVEILPVRKKSSNYPVVVGADGDYLGYGSLAAAVEAVAKSGGGKIVLRSGYHYVGALTLPANVSLIGETGAIIDGDVTLGGLSISPQVFGNVLQDNVEHTSDHHKAGTWALLDTSGWHRVRKALRMDETGSRNARILITDGIDGAAPAVATTVILAATNVSIENVTILGDLTVTLARQCTVKNVALIGATALFTSSSNWQCIFDGIDLTQAASAGSAALATDGEYNTYQGFRFSDTRGIFAITHTEDYPVLVGCRGDNTTPANTTYSFTGARTNSATILGCEGRFAATNLDFLSTDVGKIVRAPEGLGALSFEDDGTRASSGDLLLTGAAAAFDGATPQIIVDSVNERLKKAGDTMSGALTLSALLTIAANVATNGATQDLGAITTDLTRFNVFAKLLNVSGGATFSGRVSLDDFIDTDANPLAASGQALGALARRWELFANAIDAVSLLLSGDATPAAASGQALGSLANRWELFANAIDAASLTLSGDVLSVLTPAAANQDFGTDAKGFRVHATEVVLTTTHELRLPPASCISASTSSAGYLFGSGTAFVIPSTFGPAAFYPIVLPNKGMIITGYDVWVEATAAGTLSSRLYEVEAVEPPSSTLLGVQQDDTTVSSSIKLSETGLSIPVVADAAYMLKIFHSATTQLQVGNAIIYYKSA